MSGRVDKYRADLRSLPDWEPYLRENSGLPGPRANLELVAAVGEEAGADQLWRLSASSDEFLALCGTAGLGRIAISEPEPVLKWLHELASDPRWRVREGVAMALQRLGRDSMPRLVAHMKVWAKEGPFVQRAAAAALCEPPLLKGSRHAADVVFILDGITQSIATTIDRRDEGFRVLRQAMGYCWSVAAAAAPTQAQPAIEKWLRSKDRDVTWIVKTNLGKARMSVLGKDWVAAHAGQRATPAARPAPKPKPKPKARPARAKVKAKSAAKRGPAKKTRARR